MLFEMHVSKVEQVLSENKGTLSILLASSQKKLSSVFKHTHTELTVKKSPQDIRKFKSPFRCASLLHHVLQMNHVKNSNWADSSQSSFQLHKETLTAITRKTRVSFSLSSHGNIIVTSVRSMHSCGNTHPYTVVHTHTPGRSVCNNTCNCRKKSFFKQMSNFIKSLKIQSTSNAFVYGAKRSIWIWICSNNILHWNEPYFTECRIALWLLCVCNSSQACIATCCVSCFGIGPVSTNNCQKVLIEWHHWNAWEEDSQETCRSTY